MPSNRRVLLAARPTGVAQAEHFRIDKTESIAPGNGEVLIRNRFLSVEPAMRGWIADLGNYSEPVAVGAVMRSLAAGEIVESRLDGYAPGDRVTGWFGWQDYATVGAGAILRKVTENDLPLSLSLGVLGINGVTALLALTLIGQPKAGETVLVSTAAGAVGSAVGQIAKILGCRTVGIAGSTEKVRLCLDVFGFDAAINYREGDIAASIARECPSGIDVYFDNVAGKIGDTALKYLAQRARVVVCGTASISDWSAWPSGPRVERHLLVKRARMEGFVIFDHVDRWAEAVDQLAEWVRTKQLCYSEDMLHGIESAPDALAGLYRGENHGKRIIAI